jgi:N-acetylglucosaminyldiphosphoundecaprenol N-acetyl-beta-D-mannosaminyltransferase
MRSLKKINIFDYNVFADKLESIIPGNDLTVIDTLNAYSYVVAKSDPDFKTALQKADILLPDGFPVVTAAKWLKKEKIRKIAGADIFFYLCNYLNENKGSCFFLGASQSTLDSIKENLKNDFPNIKSNFFSPPYRKEFSESENQEMIEQVNKVNPDVLFVGMTAPKQEKWVHKNAERINAKIICSIGAVFDFYAGSVNRPSEFWIRLKLEWFIRMLKEPKRLWKRYLVYSPIFFIDLILYKLKIKNASL